MSLYIQLVISIRIASRRASITPALSVVPIAFIFTSASAPTPYRGFHRSRTRLESVEAPQRTIGQKVEKLIRVLFLGSVRFDMSYTACDLSNHPTDTFSCAIPGKPVKRDIGISKNLGTPAITASLLLAVVIAYICFRLYAQLISSYTASIWSDHRSYARKTLLFLYSTTIDKKEYHL